MDAEERQGYDEPSRYVSEDAPGSGHEKYEHSTDDEQ